MRENKPLSLGDLPKVCSMPTHPARFLNDHHEGSKPHGFEVKPCVDGRFITEQQAAEYVEIRKFIDDVKHNAITNDAPFFGVSLGQIVEVFNLTIKLENERMKDVLRQVELLFERGCVETGGEILDKIRDIIDEEKPC